MGPPVGPLDFHDGTAELVIGGLHYSPAVQTILRYHGRDVVKVIPGRSGEPGKINAVFANDRGDEILALKENEWVGSLKNWDIEVAGARLEVRRPNGQTALRLRLDPPGRIVVEYLDMRIGNAHLLATERTYAAGRYVGNYALMAWVHATIRIYRGTREAAVIEFTDDYTLEARDFILRDIGKSLATADRQIVMHSDAGVMIKPTGVVVGGWTGAFDLQEVACGNQTLGAMREIIREQPDRLCEFIATGKVK